MVESKPQKKHFTAFVLHFPKIRVGQAHPGPPANYTSEYSLKILPKYILMLKMTKTFLFIVGF